MKIDNIINRGLDNASKSLADSFRKLSSGKRIDKASDDPAGLALAAKLNVETRILSKGSDNISYGQSAINIADSALQQVGEIDQRLAELATQSANGTLSDGQRVSLNQEFQALSQQKDQIVANTTFNDTQLLNNETSVAIETGSGTPINVDFGSVTSTAGLDISTQAGAKAVLDQVSANIDSVTQARADLGAADSRLSSAKSSVESRILGNQQAESTIRDVDVAQETASLLTAKIRQQANVALAAQSKISKGSVLDLLG